MIAPLHHADWQIWDYGGAAALIGIKPSTLNKIEALQKTGMPQSISGTPNQRRLPFCAFSNLTLMILPSKDLPSSLAIAARASWPSISTKPKPLHWPENMSLASLSE